MGSKYKIGKAFYSELKESISDLGKRYRKETGKKRSSIFDKSFRKIVQSRVDRILEGDRYVKKSLNGSTKKYNELMKVRDKFNAGGTMSKKKKKTKDPLISKYKRIRNTIIAAPEAVPIGEAIIDLIGMGGFDDGALVSKKRKKLRPVKPKKLESVKPSEKQIPESNKGLKPIPPENKGLKKLPRGVRNKMGYMKDGGKAKVSKLGSEKDPMTMLNQMLDKKIPPLTRKEKIKLKAIDIKDKTKKVIKYGGYSNPKKKSTGGSVIVPVKIGKNKPTKIM